MQIERVARRSCREQQSKRNNSTTTVLACVVFCWRICKSLKTNVQHYQLQNVTNRDRVLYFFRQPKGHTVSLLSHHPLEFSWGFVGVGSSSLADNKKPTDPDKRDCCCKAKSVKRNC